MARKKKFLRSKWRTYSKLGKGRKKKQKYRKPVGRQNKMRERRKGNPKKVEIGYKKPEKKQEFKIIFNIKDLLSFEGNEKVILGKVGKKKKTEIAKKAKEMKIKIQNLNTDKFLKKIEKEIKKKKEEKEKQEKKKAEKKKKKEEIKKSEKNMETDKKEETQKEDTENKNKENEKNQQKNQAQQKNKQNGEKEK